MYDKIYGLENVRKYNMPQMPNLNIRFYKRNKKEEKSDLKRKFKIRLKFWGV